VDPLGADRPERWTRWAVRALVEAAHTGRLVKPHARSEEAATRGRRPAGWGGDPVGRRRVTRPGAVGQLAGPPPPRGVRLAVIRRWDQGREGEVLDLTGGRHGVQRDESHAGRADGSAAWGAMWTSGRPAGRGASARTRDRGRCSDPTKLHRRRSRWVGRGSGGSLGGCQRGAERCQGLPRATTPSATADGWEAGRAVSSRPRTRRGAGSRYPYLDELGPDWMPSRVEARSPRRPTGRDRRCSSSSRSSAAGRPSRSAARPTSCRRRRRCRRGRCRPACRRR